MAITPEAGMAMRAKALDRREKKLDKRIHPDKELLAKYMNKPPTLETLFGLIRGGRLNPESAKACRIYLIRHLVDTATEKKLAIKASMADREGTTLSFARALFESRARKQGRAKAKEQLLEEIKQVIRKIKSQSRVLLNVAEREAMAQEPIKASIVRHSGQGVINLAILQPLNTLLEEIEKL
ncbi:MAG: hypothetical protein WC634_03545 [archaeon]